MRHQVTFFNSLDYGRPVGGKMVLDTATLASDLFGALLTFIAQDNSDENRDWLANMLESNSKQLRTGYLPNNWDETATPCQKEMEEFMRGLARAFSASGVASGHYTWLADLLIGHANVLRGKKHRRRIYTNPLRQKNPCPTCGWQYERSTVF